MTERAPEPTWAGVWEWLGIETEVEQTARFARLRVVCRNILARRRCYRVEAGDVASEVFVRLAKRFGTDGLPGDASPFAYMRGVALNVAREMCRDGGREMQLLDDVVIVVPPPDATMECHQRCFDGLSVDDRGLLLTYVDADAAEREQMARDLGISLNLLRVRINAIRRRLHACRDRCLSGQGVAL